MNKVKVSAEHDYEVLIGSDWAPVLITKIQERTRVAVIVSSQYSPDLSALKSLDCDLHVFKVPDGEDGKSSNVLLNLWNWLGAAGFTRSDLIVGIGGGAVTDLAGFAAATWLRGIDWIAVPTSLAGMVDAAVGGKTGINSDYGKNLIGAFHSPLLVIIDPSFLETLSLRDISAGMAEVIKCGFIADPEILKVAAECDATSLVSNKAAVLDLVTRAVTVKAAVVSSDFKESFAREALNYGHTLGHAIEKYSKYQMRHGEAVAIGMVFIAELASARSLIDAKTLQMHRDLLTRYELPTTFERSAWQKLVPLLALDKKVRGNTIRFVALDGIGSTLRLDDLTSDELDAAYERISS
ncbi:MAG: 3-dehydroquinate synthase [Actinomycetales bacterium]|nr:3-dehydroquinate synthase [Actinomycetales bacterium]